MKYVSLILLFTAPLLLFTCNKESQSELDRELIIDYLSMNSLDAEEDPSGIFYIIEEPGSGNRPGLDSLVTVCYKGYLLDGTVFDETQDGVPVTFLLANLIEGWQIALPLLEEGGKGTFIIPSNLGFGSNPPPGIPSNAVLIFDIELKEDQAVVDREILLDYLAENNIMAEADPSGLFYEIEEAGTNDRPTVNSDVTVSYKGSLLDGTVFDETDPGETVTFKLSNLIMGWQIGIPKIGRGGSTKLYIPSGLGYGSFPPSGDIPPNSILIFEITLVDFSG